VGDGVLATVDAGERIVALAIDTLGSEASRRAYRRALTSFLDWCRSTGVARLDRATVQAYKQHLLESGLSPASINQALSAIRTLAAEAGHNGHLTPALAQGIVGIKGVKQSGVRSGNWLTRDQAQQLLDIPSTGSIRGLRDRAILAVLLGCGLRRSEVAALTTDHIQQRDGRWAVLDLVGKGRRVRTVPMPAWTKAAIDIWTGWAGIDAGRVFRSINKGGKVSSSGMTDQAIADVVRAYAGPLGVQVAAHDLRRTFAKLALSGDARIEQISLSLGHASIQTTERYLGVQQDLQDAPCDRLGLRYSEAP
jgi:site-specific recombinase XerD